jgi:threonine dehydratase
VLTGGNIDLLLLDDLVRQGLAARGRFASLSVRVPDRPGSLAGLLEEIGDAGGNILSVTHHRAELGVPFGLVEISLSMETRSSRHFAAIRERLRGYDVTATHGGGTSGSPS